ncbi:MAG TPA: hypothetical protein VFO85_14385, partial [Vicinamibacteria bacterium]|nr:hypothetical protein [Vicinamibacteria bacterium]
MPRPLALGAALLAFFTQDPLAARVKQTAYARMDRALAISRDGAVVGFVEASNGGAEPEAEIRKRDARWKAGGEAALRKEVTSSPCAQRLRTLVRDDSFVLEAILMDAQGVIVCSTVETSDYWQGDEDK